MFYATIFQLKDQISVISPPHSSIAVCLEFLKHFVSQIDSNAIGAACLSSQTLMNMGINPI